MIEILPILVPFAVLQVLLAVIALVHLFKHPKCIKLSRPVWAVIVIVIGFIGPILYFTIGRGEEE